MSTIAVTGSTGGVGRGIAELLARAGREQRLVVRDPSRAPQLPGASVVVAAYGDAAALGRALEGVTTLCFVSATESADRLQQHRTVVDEARRAGVERVVYTSIVGAAPDATFTLARDHFHTEQAVVAAGLAHCFLRASLYTDFLAHLVGVDGVLRGPAGDGRLVPVVRADVAAAAAAVLLADGDHDGRTYDLTGPTLVTLGDVAGELARRTGRPIRFHHETVEEAYASRAHFGAAPWEVAGWVSTYCAIAAGELEVVSDAVERLTGQPPQGPLAWLDEHPEAYLHLLG